MRSPNDGVHLETPPAQTVTAVDDDGTNKARSTAAPACPDRLPGSGEGAGAVGGGLDGSLGAPGASEGAAAATADVREATCVSRVSKAVAVAAWFARTSASSAPTSAVAVGVPNSVSGSASGSGARSGLAPDTEARRRRGVRLGIQIWPSGSKDKEQLSDANGVAPAARDSLLDARGVAGPLAHGEGL